MPLNADYASSASPATLQCRLDLSMQERYAAVLAQLLASHVGMLPCNLFRSTLSTIAAKVCMHS